MPAGPILMLFVGVFLLAAATVFVHPFFFFLVPLFVFIMVAYGLYKKQL